MFADYDYIWPEFVGLILALLGGPPLAIATHELGHAVAGRAVGIPIRFIKFGSGKPWFSFRIAAARVIVSGVWRGSVVAYAVYHVGRGARAAYFAGGAGLNLIVALSMFCAASAVADLSDVAVMALTVAGAMQALGVSNVVRRRPRKPWGNITLADGGHLRALIGQDQAPFERLRAANLARFAAYGEPPQRLDASAIRVLTLIDAALGATAEERREYLVDARRERQRRHIKCVRLLLLDGVVTRLLYLDSETDPAMLEDWSEELFRLAPANTTVRGSRASALAFAGRCAEAKPELVALLDGDPPPFDRFVCAASLARVEMALGDGAAAERALDICYAVADAAPEFRDLPAWSLAAAFAERIGYRERAKNA